VAQTHDNAPNKPVHLMFLAGTVVAFYLCKWSIDWIWGYFGTPPSELVQTAIAGAFALTLGITLYKRDKTYTYASEIAAELGKVTWPTAKEVRAATIVVLVMGIVSALILGMFDFVWSSLTEVVYG
jgi:preprotein translocase subunit SecE